MIDIKFLRENPDAVKENIKKKFQDSKLPLVDEVIELDAQLRKAQQRGDSLRADRNRISKEIGGFMAKGQKDEAEKAKIALSNSTSVNVNIPYITADATGPKHLETTLTRAKFNEMTADLVEATMGPVRQAMKDSGLAALQ